MDLKDAAPENWQEERYTLQRLLVRTSLFAAGQDGAVDALLERLRKALRHDDCTLADLRHLQHDLDQALERFDGKRAESERALKAVLAQLLEVLEDDGSASHKQYRSLEKQIGKLELDSETVASWLSRVVALAEQERAVLSKDDAKDDARGGWRRFFSRHDSHHDSHHDDESKLSVPTPRPTEVASNHVEQVESDDAEQRLRIARRIGELLGHVLDQVSLEPAAHARALHLKQLLDQSYEWRELRDALNEIVDLVIAAVSRGRTEFEDFLKRLDERLATLKANCEAQMEAGAVRRTATDALDQALSSQLEDMGSAVSRATSLDQLKTSVTQNIQAISDSFRTYRDDESQREKVLEEKLSAMQEKLAGMEAYSEQVQEQLRTERSRALTDMLTQLPNREAWQQRLQLEFDRWQRYQHPISLTVLDIDHFKKVNDSFGHKAGDRVIQLVARALCDRLRATDFVARYGGEEFVILLPETDADVAYKVLEDLRLHIASLPFHFQNQPVAVTVSAGITSFIAGSSHDELFDRADKALYRAKNEGRNRVVRA
ncbi:sensor domain-containing diguanylate cyclase [Marinobacter fonticola]|uniref:sensor domain-containing diguanylate cyclase n=1 Tax=Marinobacter fonticola TaxID=2603215 RepID=UPI0011E6814E|nr:GGDEF domain-containing protein [Marinobacter fonticola]